MEISSLPERIKRIEDLAFNMWWSWHENARSVFRILDYPLWRISEHNPVRELRHVQPETVQKAAESEVFRTAYDSVIAALDTDLTTSDTWLKDTHPSLLENPVAYFSMEFAFHTSLPIYAGGLGILAGDICKEASDLGQPMVAIGFMYPQGYFHQHVSPQGWQEEVYPILRFEDSPVKPVFTENGDRILAHVRMGEADLALRAWLVKVGRTNVYLIDTNLEENPPQYRDIVSRLYTAESEHRLQQEIILGIGGVRVLKALGFTPRIWHGNEGHTSFMMLERVREEVASGKTFQDAMKAVRDTTVFTTHTPVRAGHDTFTFQLMEKYFSEYWKTVGIDRETFLGLGRFDGYDSQSFNMTALALRIAGHSFGVSKLHGQVTRKMWNSLWPEKKEEEVPISHITNGIHIPSWIAPTMANLFSEYLGEDWLRRQDDTGTLDKVMNIPDEKIWDVHLNLKRKLGVTIRERMRKRWSDHDVSLEQLIALGALLDPDALTIAFSRRFAEYKRPTLLLRDMERLKKIALDEWYPVNFLFSGKSHPADINSKKLLQQVYNLAADPAFKGRIIFLEDYDMHLARFLVQGVDIWLNNPRRLKEASGTSGMKAAVNGVLNLSVRDGWWLEGYNGKNGWAIGGDIPIDDPEEEDRQDSASLFRLLEEEIIPMFYERDRHGIPHAWSQMMKESIRTILPAFSARRMVKQYIEFMYDPDGAGRR